MLMLPNMGKLMNKEMLFCVIIYLREISQVFLLSEIYLAVGRHTNMLTL